MITCKNVHYFILWTVVSISLVIFSCSSPPREGTTDVSETPAIIPIPVQYSLTEETFTLDEKTTIDAPTDEARAVGQYLQEFLNKATGHQFVIDPTAGTHSIALNIINDSELGKEGYELDIRKTGVSIRANTSAGLFYGVQTLRQMLPVNSERANELTLPCKLRGAQVKDFPRYAWRGSMLDVARHFFTVDEVKRYIDYISFYKMNILHLHLSDDQGWRIEIKSWPQLTSIGGKSEVGGGEGGFYTQEDYAQIIDYAAKRHITVIPEIDLPGHINAALVSYPELLPPSPISVEAPNEAGRKPEAGKPHTGIEVGFSTLDINNPTTFRFIEDVLTELSAMTTGPYLHIGGDEAAVTKKKDYISFVNRIKKIVQGLGKTMVGWEEIAQGEVDSTIIIQHWDKPVFAELAAEKGAQILLSPSKKVYLDMQYDSSSRIGLHWAAYIEVDSAYRWDPAKILDRVDQQLILGVEAPLWTETAVNIADIDYLTFPRLAGVAEIAWSPQSSRSWEGYKDRLRLHGNRWEAMGIQFYRSPLIPWNDTRGQ